LVLILFSISIFFPLYLAVITSLKTGKDLSFTVNSLFPEKLRFLNYVDVFKNAPIGSAIWNSTKITGIVLLGSLLTSSMAGYAFAKLKFKGREWFFSIVLSSMMFPGLLALLPMFVVYKEIGWIDTHLPLIVPPLMANAFNVFLLRQFFRTIPDSLIESGKIDGAGYVMIYWRIMLPLCLPVLATVGLFTFKGIWNDFIGPLFYLTSADKFTLPIMVNYFKNRYTEDWNMIMTVSCISVLPILVLFQVFQRFLIDGLMVGAVKG